MTDFSTPRRMSAGAFVIMFLKSFKKILGSTFIIMIYMVYKSIGSESEDGLLLGIGILAGFDFLVSFIEAFVKFYFRKFHIEGDKLIYTSGFAQKQTTSIPLSRVHTLRTKKGWFYRVLDMRGIAFDTLATDRQEVELILDESDWQMLLRRVSKGENFPHVDDSIALPPPLVDNTWSISNADILKGALCQNHLKGFSILAAAVFTVYDQISQVGDDPAMRIIDYLESHLGDMMPTAWQLVSILVAMYLIVTVLWTCKIILRYGNMTLRITDNLLTIESGLVSRFTCRLTREKITTLAIKRNPLERITGCQTITLRQAENATDAKNEGAIRIYGSDFGDKLLAWWLGDRDGNNDTTLITAASGKGLMVRRLIPNLILAVGVGAVVILCLQTVLPVVILGVVYAGVAAMRAVMAWKHGGIELKESYVRINRGNIACIREYIRCRDIESVGISSSPFTPYTRRVSLKITTNADFTKVYSLAVDKALAIRNLILIQTAGSACCPAITEVRIPRLV